ncbi:hypothetical protein ABH935_000081 [Catenulispora sp. GAS73]|uniref:hypothetical protein n=1 Tax=Catenulispora sp. GAS73 TaxID=3156269 RepID=UPI003518E872
MGTGYVPQWYDEFEDHLDGMLAVLRPEWHLPEQPPAHAFNRPESMSRWRTNAKRSALGSHVREHPAQARAHLPGLLDAVVHDLNASFNEFLILPIIAAVGHRPVHEGIIERLARGTFIEQLGAVAAWYTAQPGLHYRSADDLRRGEPAQDSVRPYTEWLDVLPRYQEACRSAVERCDDPERRAYLSRRVAASCNGGVSIGTPPQE